MSDRPTVAFRIERVRDGFFVPVLVDDTGYEHFRCSPCACADQAAYSAANMPSAKAAVRAGTLEYLGMTELRNGERADIDDRFCWINKHDPLWRQHGFTHGTLKRLEAAHA